MGRPSKYDPKFCDELIEFFDQEPYTDVKIPHYDAKGNVKWNDIKRMANKMPTLRNFAKELGMGISTLYDWMNKEHASYHKEFSDAFTHARDLRKWFLIENGLNGCYNPIFAKFVAINVTDMRDKKVFEGDPDKPIPISMPTVEEWLANKLKDAKKTNKG